MRAAIRAGRRLHMILRRAQSRRTARAGATRAPGLTVERDPAMADLRFLDGQLDGYNVATTGVPYGGRIAVFLRDETLAIVGGLSGWTWGNSLEVLTLWVRDDWRGKGYGARLLAAAEAEALARGCRQVHLNTFAFQAPGFYERHGYTVFGVLEDYLDGQHRYYLKKILT